MYRPERRPRIAHGHFWNVHVDNRRPAQRPLVSLCPWGHDDVGDPACLGHVQVVTPRFHSRHGGQWTNLLTATAGGTAKRRQTALYIGVGDLRRPAVWTGLPDFDAVPVAAGSRRRQPQYAMTVCSDSRAPGLQCATGSSGCHRLLYRRMYLAPSPGSQGFLTGAFDGRPLCSAPDGVSYQPSQREYTRQSKINRSRTTGRAGSIVFSGGSHGPTYLAAIGLRG